MSEIHRSGNPVPFSTASFLTQARDMMTVSRIIFVFNNFTRKVSSAFVLFKDCWKYKTKFGKNDNI